MDDLTRKIHEANLLARQTNKLEESLNNIEQKGYEEIDQQRVDLLKSKIKQNRHNLSTAASRIYSGGDVQNRKDNVR